MRYRVVICIDLDGEFAIAGTTLTEDTSTDLLADMLRESDNLSEFSIFFTVRAISSNILTCQGSQLTEFIPYGVSTGGGSGELAAPANVRWDAANPGFLKWDAAEGAESYRVEVSLDGEFIWGDYTSSTTYAFAQRYPWLESGTYTATVASVVWEDNGQRITSDPVSGGSFAYAAPAARMETPGNPRWNGTTAVWDAVEGTNVQY